MELAAVNSPAAAFVAGLVTSLHCVGMCGPLACVLLPIRGPGAAPAPAPETVSTVYHATRLASYTALGALAGGLGQAPLTALSQSALRWLPWIFVLFFVALALRWDRHLPRLGLIGPLAGRIQSWIRGRSPLTSAAVIGFATPLLPCGPLYFLLALALLSGSALRGVEFMLAFGLGTVPLLWLAQSQIHWARQRFSPLWVDRTRAALALAAAAMIAWRLRATLGLPGPDPASFICF